MPCHHINFVTFHSPRELNLRFLDHDTVTKYRGDFLDLCFVPPLQYASQLLGDLPTGKVQTHEIQAQHPYGQRLMVSGEHGFGQVVKGPMTQSAKVTLPVRLGFIVSVFNDFGRVAMRAFDAFRPSQLSNHLVTLGVVNQSVNVQSHPAFFT